MQHRRLGNSGLEVSAITVQGGRYPEALQRLVKR